MIAGLENALVDYYVEAVDARGNITRSDIQHVWVGAGSSTPGGNFVEITPNPAVAGQSVLVTYNPAGGPLVGASQVLLHYGFNNWQTIVGQDLAMTWNAASSTWNVSLPVATTANQFDLVFNNGAGLWHNNGGQDWHFSVTGAQVPSFTMDGVKDASAAQVAVNGARHLYAALSGNTLYVATEDAGEGNDVFLYLADAPSSLAAANWAKSGQIAQWDAYLADENSNDYESWFDAAGTAQAATGANGGVLEGVIDLISEFGSMPKQIYLAVGAYANPDGGALVATQQVPASVNGNGNIDASEYLLLQIIAGQGDYNRDGHVDAADYDLWRSAFGSSSDLRADGNGNGVIDTPDYVLWRHFNGTAAGFTIIASGIGNTATVPEPTGFLLVLFVTAPLIAFRRR